MNALVENNYIKELPCGSNFSYILNENNMFSSTEYKVLQSQANSCFIRCMKMLYNGKIQLFYLTSMYKPLSVLLNSLDADSFMTICANLFADITDVKNNGFLSCQNIDISFDRIYVDQSTYKVSLVYLPVSQRIFEDISSFENELRTSLVKLIQGMSSLSNPKTLQFVANLTNGSISLEELSLLIKGGSLSVHKVKHEYEDYSASSNTQIKLVAMNAPNRVEIIVNKNEFKLGKKAELVDGVIGFNKMISRLHCKIVKNGMQYSIIDLQSANGTYVNHVRLQPNQPCPIKNGDIVRLANSDFQIVEE